MQYLFNLRSYRELQTATNSTIGLADGATGSGFCNTYHTEGRIVKEVI